jgi:predicted phage tail protein
MGLIRKSLMVGTLGGVSGSSKKQRVAKASLRELKQQTALLAQIADPGAAARQHATVQAARDARQARRDARRGPNVVFVEKPQTVRPARQSKTLRTVCGVVMIFFALAAIGAMADGSVGGSIACVLVSITAFLLMSGVIPRRALTQSSTEEAPASQEPIR